MAGHSKWKNIQHRKGAQDKKRAKAFQIASKEILVAIQGGGNDPLKNPRLKLAIDKAKAANVPKDNINKLLNKSNKDKTNYSELTYEAYAPGGVAMLIDCLTDNVNRTVSKVKAVLTKNGGSLATNGAVSYQFSTKGIIELDKSIDEEKVMEKAIELEAENFEVFEDYYLVTTTPKNWQKVNEKLKEIGYQEYLDSGIKKVSENKISLDNPKQEKLDKLIDLLLEIEDVSEVYTNLE